jgi:hypothetical protein
MMLLLLAFGFTRRREPVELSFISNTILDVIALLGVGDRGSRCSSALHEFREEDVGDGF